MTGLLYMYLPYHSPILSIFVSFLEKVAYKEKLPKIKLSVKKTLQKNEQTGNSFIYCLKKTPTLGIEIVNYQPSSVSYGHDGITKSFL